MNIEGVIFDMDGVLVDTAKYHFQSWQQVALELGINLDSEVKDGIKGLNRMDSLALILDKADITLDNRKKKELMDMKNSIFLDSLPSSPADIILKVVLPLIEHLKNKSIPMAVASSSKNAHHILHRTKLSGHFKSILDSTNTLRSKPHPEVFINSARNLQLPEQACLIIEDGFNGVQAAKKASFYVLGIGDTTILKEADMVLDSLDGFQLGLFEDYIGRQTDD